MANRSSLISFSKCVIIFFLLTITNIPHLQCQSKLYKSVSSTSLAVNRLMKEEVFSAPVLHLGNIQEEMIISDFDVKKVILKSKSEKSYSENALSSFFNKHSDVKTLHISPDVQENKANILLNLDYENLKYIENVIIDWDEKNDHSSFIKKITLSNNIKNLTIISENPADLKITPSFLSLISRLSGLHLRNINFIPSTQKLSSKNLVTLVIENHKSSSESIRHLLEYFASCKNISEIIFDQNIPLDFNALDYLKQYKKLNVLDLNCKSFKAESMPYESITNFPEIKSLHLMNANQCVHNGIHKFKSLKKLDLRFRNQKIELHEDIYKLKNLEVLSFDSDIINPQISNLKKLKKLQLKGGFSSFPNSLFTLKRLEYLNIACSNVDSLFRRIDEFKNLEFLILESYIIKTIPNAITALTNLKHVEINSYLEVESIPEHIGNLKKLEVFKLKSSYLKTFPKSFANLNKLKTLEIQGSKDAPIEVYNGITFLKRDTFYRNLLNSIPSLKQLEYLNLSYNKFTKQNLLQLLTILKQDRFQNLTLHLSHCWIKTLPEYIWNDLKLKFLDLSDNEINYLPDSFLKSNIEDFDLTNNSNSISLRYPNKMWMYLTALHMKRLNPSDIKEKFEFINFATQLLNYQFYNLFATNLAFQVDSTYATKAFTSAQLGNYYFSQEDYTTSIELYKSAKVGLINSNESSDNLNYSPLSDEWIRYALSLYYLGKVTEFKNNVYEMYNQSNQHIEKFKVKCQCQALQKLQNSDRINLGILLNQFDKELAAIVWEPKISKLERLTMNEYCKTGNYTELLELYLASENYESFDSLYLHTLLNIPKNSNDEIVLEYLKITKDVIMGLDKDESIKRLKRTLKQKAPITTNWNTSYIEMWAILSNNPYASRVQKINRIIQPSLNHLPIPMY